MSLNEWILKQQKIMWKKLKDLLDDFSCVLAHSCQSTLLQLTCTKLPDAKKPEEIIWKKFSAGVSHKRRSKGALVCVFSYCSQSFE